MKFFSYQEDIYGMFLCKYGILTKTGTYLSFKLNLVFFVNFREKIEKFHNYLIRKSIYFPRYLAHKIFKFCFQREITQKRGIIRTRKKTRVNYFFMRNTHMKFQIPNIHHSKVNRRTHAHTHRQTDKPKAICPSNFFKVGGINTIQDI